MSAQLNLGLSVVAPTPPPTKKETTWGGARPGAGRTPSGKRRDPLHRSRPPVLGREPQHVVLRTVRSLPRLRRRKIYDCVRVSLRRMLGKLDFRVCHLSIQHNHLHFLVEAADAAALTAGMQGLAISLARRINKMLRRKGKVFAFRYHATAIKTPRQARHTLAYVLNNWRRHNEDERTLASRFAAIDPYSSARSFSGWKECRRIELSPGFEGFAPLDVAAPRTWLLRSGWQKAGVSISAYATPGPPALVDRQPRVRKRTSSVTTR
jgi:putative transposase